MMLPVVRAVLESLSKDTESGHGSKYPFIHSFSTDFFHYQSESTLFSKGALIAVAYSSSIGGLSTLTGTGTNLVLAGQVSLVQCRL